LKYSDFGLSKRIEQNSEEEYYLEGTGLYMSPELYK